MAGLNVEVAIDPTRVFVREPIALDREESFLEAPSFDRSIIEGDATGFETDPLYGIPLWTGSFQFIAGGIGRQNIRTDQEAFADVKAFDDFIAFAMGRARSFWIPSWKKDFHLLTNYTSGAATVTVAAANFDRLYAFFHAQAGLSNPTPLALFVYNESTQTQFVRGIKDLGSDGSGNAVLTLHATMNENLSALPFFVRHFCLMRRCVLASDSVDYDYLTPGCVKCALGFEQVPFEGEDFRT